MQETAELIQDHLVGLMLLAERSVEFKVRPHMDFQRSRRNGIGVEGREFRYGILRLKSLNEDVPRPVTVAGSKGAHEVLAHQSCRRQSAMESVNHASHTILMPPRLRAVSTFTVPRWNAASSAGVVGRGTHGQEQEARQDETCHVNGGHMTRCSVAIARCLVLWQPGDG